MPSFSTKCARPLSSPIKNGCRMWTGDETRARLVSSLSHFRPPSCRGRGRWSGKLSPHSWSVTSCHAIRYNGRLLARSIVSCQISELKMPQHRLILVIILVYLTPEHFPLTKVLQHRFRPFQRQLGEKLTRLRRSRSG